ncbi:MAG: DUF1571 domain-containing protein [Thermoguttaceae bacterium]|nr:DUF1571 domain-containing protein [Thermoguttaceae bacterium]
MRKFLRSIYLICFLLVGYVLFLIQGREQGSREEELAKCVDYSELKKAQMIEYHGELAKIQHIFEQDPPSKRQPVFEITEEKREELREGISQAAEDLRKQAEAQLERPVPPLLLHASEEVSASTYEPQNIGEFFEAQDRVQDTPPNEPANKQQIGKQGPSQRSVYAGNWQMLNPLQSAWRSRLEEDRKAVPVLERPLDDTLEPPMLLSEVRSAETNVPEPQTDVPEPQTNVPEPQTDVPEPQTDVPEPQTNVPEPQTNVPEPQTNAPESETEADRALEELLDDAIQQEQLDDAKEREERGKKSPTRQHTDTETVPAAVSGKQETGSPAAKAISAEEEPYDHEQGLQILRSFNQLAKKRLETYDQEIRNYSCILYKWDRTNKLIREMDVMEIKLREEPYSIYAYTLYPLKNRGREWLFWEGHYRNELLIYGGPKLPKTLSFPLDSSSIQKYSERPIQQMGFRRLLEELVELSNDESIFRDSIIRSYDNGRVGDRDCLVLQVTFLTPQTVGEENFYQIQIYVDKKLLLPIQLIIYDRPQPGKEPEIRESYQYVIMEMNPGFTDADFCHLNPEYGFSTYIPGMDEEVRQLRNYFQFPDKGK